MIFKDKNNEYTVANIFRISEGDFITAKDEEQKLIMLFYIANSEIDQGFDIVDFSKRAILTSFDDPIEIKEWLDVNFNEYRIIKSENIKISEIINS